MKLASMVSYYSNEIQERIMGKWVVNDAISQSSMISKISLMGNVMDTYEVHKLKLYIHELNRRFPRRSKIFRYAVPVYKESLFGLITSDHKVYFVTANSQKAAIKKVLKSLS